MCLAPHSQGAWLEEDTRVYLRSPSPAVPAVERERIRPPPLRGEGRAFATPFQCDACPAAPLRTKRIVSRGGFGLAGGVSCENPGNSFVPIPLPCRLAYHKCRFLVCHRHKHPQPSWDKGMKVVEACHCEAHAIFGSPERRNHRSRGQRPRNQAKNRSP